MKTCLKWLVLASFLALTLYSCATPKKLGYLMDMEYGTDYPAAPSPELIVQVDDLLGIHISSENPQLVAPFNLISEKAESASVHTYAVNAEGNIDFPVLGSLPVAGKTLSQVRDQIAGKIKEMGLIRNPVVLVTLENFSITVIGNAGNQVLPVTGNSKFVTGCGEVCAYQHEYENKRRDGNSYREWNAEVLFSRLAVQRPI